jgi:hypothetical protein
VKQEDNFVSGNQIVLTFGECIYTVKGGLDCSGLWRTLTHSVSPSPAGPVRWQYWPPKGGRTPDFLFNITYGREPHNQYLDMRELVS